MTASGNPRSITKRAIERDLIAVTTAREVRRLDLSEALELLNGRTMRTPVRTRADEKPW